MFLTNPVNNFTPQGRVKKAERTKKFEKGSAPKFYENIRVKTFLMLLGYVNLTKTSKVPKDKHCSFKCPKNILLSEHFLMLLNNF